MLVLSRRVDEELVFPGLDIRIKILRSEGNRVRLGIEAPKTIEVSRGERLLSGAMPAESSVPSRHAFRNLQNVVRLALELYDRQVDRGDIDGANQTFLQLVAQLRKAELNLTCLPQPQPTGNAGPKVLVVDDDANERQLLAGLLQMDGCIVETAYDGMQAVELLQAGPTPDVVLLDMQMPRLSGKETLSAIRARAFDVLVFGVSGSTAAENNITLGRPHGIDEWFEKPLNPAQLVSRMRQRLTETQAMTV